jgi:hypothetical protein
MNETKRHVGKRRIMAHSYATLSGEERIARVCRLIEDAWENMSAEGKSRFMSRNFKMRKMRKTEDGWKPVQNT